MPRAVNAHALPAVLTALRLPSFHGHWQALAEQSATEGWPTARFVNAGLSDAHVITTIPTSGGPRLDPVHGPPSKSHALQRLTQRRGRLYDEVAASNRLIIDRVRWASPIRKPHSQASAPRK